MWSSERFSLPLSCFMRQISKLYFSIYVNVLLSDLAVWAPLCTHARAHAHTHTHTHAYFPLMQMGLRIKQQEINILWNIWPYPSHRVNSCEHINQIKLIFFFSPSHLGENIKNQRGLPWWYSGWGASCQCGGHGLDPWSGKIPHAKEQLSPWGTTTEPSSCNYWAHAPRARAPLQGKTPQWGASVLQKRQPPFAATRESLHCNEDPVQPKINK